MRKLLIGLVVLAGLFLAADFGLKALAEAQTAKVLQGSLDLSTKPAVSLGGFPFLLHLASGDFPSVTLEAGHFEVHGVPLDRVEITLRDVSFSTAELLGGRNEDIRVRDGSGTARITGAGVTAALREEGVPASVRFEAGRALVSSSQLPGEVPADLAVRNGKLVLSAEEATQPYSSPLPPIVNGIRYTGVRIDDDTAVLSFTVDRTSFQG